jgi:hypothetical protein
MRFNSTPTPSNARFVQSHSAENALFAGSDGGAEHGGIVVDRGL